MSFKKQAVIMISNAVLGLFTCYLYLFFWVAFSMGSPILNIEAMLSLIVSLTLFAVTNVLLIHSHKQKSWVYAASTYFVTIVVFVSIFTFS